jgi:hypothetical protein
MIRAAKNLASHRCLYMIRLLIYEMTLDSGENDVRPNA